MNKILLSLLSNILFSAPPVLLVLVYARAGSFEDSAALGMALAVCAPLQLFFSMQHGLSILSGRMSLQSALSMRVLLLAPLLFLSAAAAWILKEPIIIVFALYRVGDFLYEPFFFDLIRQARMGIVFTQSSTRFLLQFMCGWLGLYFSADILVVVSLLAFVNVLYSILKINRCRGLLSLGFSREYFSGFFLGAGALIAAVCINLPRYFLSSGKVEDLAVYSNILTIVMGGTLLFGAVNSVVFARASSLGLKGVAAFLNRSMFVTFLGVAASLSFVAFDSALSKLFINVFLGSKYSAYYSLIVGFSVFYFILYMQNSLNLVYLYFGHEKDFMIGSAVLLTMLLVTSYWTKEALPIELDLMIWLVNLLYFLFCFSMFITVKCKAGRVK
jgi:O-antigen/teichoic acid export membrane protein